MSQGDKKSAIGRIALQQRALRDDSAEAQRDRDGRAGELTDLKELSEKFGVPAIDLRQVCVRLADLDLIPVEIARRHVILPVLVRDDRLFIAMANPGDQKVIDELEFVTDKKVFPYVTARSALSDAIETAYAMRSREEEFFIGPDCPAEVVHKATGRSEPPGPVTGSPLPTLPEPPEPEPLEQPNVVLGDALGRVAKTSDFPDQEIEELSEEHSVVTTVPSEAEPLARPGAKTVLVVDDEPDIRGMIERLLKGKGYRVVGADNGRAALSLVKEHAPDLIVLDAMLPEVHGFDIARRIKASKRYAHIPIIMVSAVYRGWRFAADLRESCGVEHYIEKPFKIAEVLRAVEESVGEGGEGEAARPNFRGSRDREMSEEAEEALHAGVAAYQAGRIEEAVLHLKRGIAVDPLAFRLHFQLGLLFGKKGQLYDAIGELERAVEINSRHFPAVRNLAILYQKAGLRNKATEMWERALNVAPDDVTRQSIKQHLLSLL